MPGQPAPPPTRGFAPVNDRRKALATAIGIIGLVVALLPALSWIRISFAGIDVSVNGWGMESVDDFGNSGDSGFEESEDSSDDDDDLGWILGGIPDGVLVSLLGASVGAVGFSLRSWADDPEPPDVRRRRLRVWWGVAAAGALGLAWVAGSWLRFDAEWDRQIEEQIGGDPFAAVFIGAIDFEPGYGLMGSGLGFAAIATCAAVVVVQERKATASGPPAPMTPPLAG